MIDEGAEAPDFELPAVAGGELESVALEEYLGREVVVLAFYPGDFNPACGDDGTDLDELDLLTMQKDVSVLAISGDSVHSHRAFADEYDLKIPLLTDAGGEVAADYGVAVDDPAAGYLTHRAVVVVGPEGEVEYGWSTEDLEESPPIERIREAVVDVGGAETAVARYRVGHAHYVEGRRAFTSAMSGFRDEEWMMARSDFRRAHEEFEEAAAHFNTAARFAEDDHDIGYFGLAEEKAQLLWQAAEWLGDSANAYASGEGAEGQAMREDAEGTLEEARRYPEPPEPDGFPPDEPPPEPEEGDADEGASFLPADEADVDTSLDVDIDEAEADAAEDLRETVEDPAAAPDADDAEAAAADGEEDEEEDAIDDAELEEITAELEQQTEDAKARRAAEETAAEDTDADEADATEQADGPAADDDEEPAELELSDPTDGEGLEPIEDDGEGTAAEDGEDDASEGVPDSA